MATKPKSFRPRGTPPPEERERQYDRQRDRDQAGRELYKTYRWQKARAEFLSLPENQFCLRCKADGLLNPGIYCSDGSVQTNTRRIHLVVHHTERHYGHPELFWDSSKWEPICPDHHDGDAQSEERSGRRTR